MIWARRVPSAMMTRRFSGVPDPVAASDERRKEQLKQEPGATGLVLGELEEMPAGKAVDAAFKYIEGAWSR